MDQLIREFPDQLREALNIGQEAQIKSHEHPIHHILVCGLGGSGIGGDFVREFIQETCDIPFLVNKGYGLPQYVGKHTLAIFSSYSGNTEETMIAFEQALSSGAKIVCISSGGKMLEQAKLHGLDYIQVPSGKPSPRACLGYSIVQQLFIVQKLGLTDDSYTKAIGVAADLLDKEQAAIELLAQQTAKKLHGKIPVIYTTEGREAVAVRLRQQLNENAKILCWHHVIPEMNHNELVGWRGDYKQMAVLYLRNDSDLKRNQIRIDINKEIISKYTSVTEIYSKGENKIVQAMYQVHFGDWLSWYISELRDGIDAVEVDVIDYLKSELSKA